MTTSEWVHVGTDPSTIEEAEKLAEDLSSSGARFTKAQILRAALALGVKSIKADPSVLLPRTRNKAASK